MNSSSYKTKLLISIIVFIFVLIHTFSSIKLDSISLALLGIAILPWVATILRRAELPGGWKFEFQEIKAEQDRQAKEVNAIKFLISNFLTKHEQDHLRKLFKKETFPVKADESSPSFAVELRKLRALGFIRQIGDEGIRTLLKKDGKERNVGSFFEITETGREYIQLYSQIALENNFSSTKH